MDITKINSDGFENPLKEMMLCQNKNFNKISESEHKHFPFQRCNNYIDDCIEKEFKIGRSKKYSQNANYTLKMKLKS